MKQSCGIFARAGCGKTTFVNQLQQELTNRGISTACVAPTNKAARLLPNGMTIHKFSQLHKSKKSIDELKADYIIVDEVSMMHEKFFKYLITIHRIKPEIKFLLVGDWDQLLPVNDRAIFDYEHSGAVHELCGGNKLQLTKCRRADAKLFKVCQNVERITKTKTAKFYAYKDLNPKNRVEFAFANTSKHICFTNKKRREINHAMMEKATKNKKAVEFKALEYDENSQDVKLVKGMPVIARKTDKDEDVANNEMFEINHIDHKNKTFIIAPQGADFETDKLIEIAFSDFQRLFYVAYALTCYKVQGCTFDVPFTIHEWDRYDSRMRYVSLSRATKIEYINII